MNGKGNEYGVPRYRFTLLIAVSFIAVCLNGCSRKGGKAASELDASFFPVSVGNQWTYKRTVFPENILLIANPDLSTEPRFSPTMKSGEETYTVVSHSDAGFAVEGKDSEGKKIFDIFEPPDFFETKLVLWKNMGVPDSIVFEEIRGGTLWGHPGFPSVIICLLKPDTSFSRMDDPMKRKITCLHSSALVAVPAGTFKGTLKNTITFVNILSSQEFRTERIFAKGVGCVKETQINANGKITYQLELKAYKVSPNDQK
ncbi:MAG: hypothetical protein WC454_01530 [Phycisphaerae bacterium]|jgi:hypothetical protein